MLICFVAALICAFAGGFQLEVRNYSGAFALFILAFINIILWCVTGVK